MLGRVSAIAALVLVAAFTTTRPDDRGRPVILLVHGRGLVTHDTAAVRTMWLDALMSGTKSVAKASLIANRDVRLVWYADVLDPLSGDGCSYAATDPRARRDAATDPELKSFVTMVGNFLTALSTFVSDSGSTGELRALSSDAAFLGNAHKRCAAEQRLADAIDRASKEGRPVILVAHSLGSLVAYDYLSSRRDTGVVQQVVTIGSPLGSSELRHLLIGGDSTESFGLPSSVRSWTNVRAAADMFAMPLAFGRDVVAETPPTEPDAHEMIGYLRSSATAGAILGGWCSAFVGPAPAGCADIPR